MKQPKEKKEKESFMNALIFYGFIAIATIGFLGYEAGSIAIGSMFILAPLLFKGTGSGGDGMLSKSPTKKIKESWQGADKKKKAGIVIGLLVLLPFFILGILWLAMMGAMFLVDILFILPVILIILWFWFRNPDHQTFNGSSSLGHPAVLGVAVMMILVIVVVATMNYTELHKYDGIDAYKVVKSYTTPDENYNMDTDGDGEKDITDTDIDNDNITNELDIDQDGDTYIDNLKPLQNYNSYNETIQALIRTQYYNIPEDHRNLIDPNVPFGEDDFENDNGTITPKTYTVKIRVFDPFSNEFFNQRTTNLFGISTSFPIDFAKAILHPRDRVNYTVSFDNSTLNETSDAVNNDKAFVGYTFTNRPLATSDVGSPIANMKVYVVALANDTSFENENTGTATVPMTTDATGTVFMKLETGDYILRIDGAGYMPFTTDFRVNNKTKETIVCLIPDYLHVDVYFQSQASGKHDDQVAWGMSATATDYKAEAEDEKSDITLYTIGHTISGFTPEEYKTIYRQNSMWGWSGMPQLVVNPSIRTNKMFQGMFNSMANGLNFYWSREVSDVYFISANMDIIASAEIGTSDGSSTVYGRTVLTGGKHYFTSTGMHQSYVVWMDDLKATQNGVSIHIETIGTVYYKQVKIHRNVIFIFHKDTPTSEIIDIPIHESFDYIVPEKEYQEFYAG